MSGADEQAEKLEAQPQSPPFTKLETPSAEEAGLDTEDEELPAACEEGGEIGEEEADRLLDEIAGSLKEIAGSMQSREALLKQYAQATKERKEMEERLSQRPAFQSAQPDRTAEAAGEDTESEGEVPSLAEQIRKAMPSTRDHAFEDDGPGGMRVSDIEDAEDDAEETEEEKDEENDDHNVGQEKQQNFETAQEALEAAEEARKKGNEAFSEGRYYGAMACYLLTGRHLSAANTLETETEMSESDYICRKWDCIEKSKLNIAACALKLEDYSGCLKACKDILDVKPDSVKALYRAGIAYMLMKDYKEAKNHLQKASELDPKEKAIQQSLKECLAKEKETQENIKNFAKKMFTTGNSPDENGTGRSSGFSTDPKDNGGDSDSGPSLRTAEDVFRSPTFRADEVDWDGEDSESTESSEQDDTEDDDDDTEASAPEEEVSGSKPDSQSPIFKFTGTEDAGKGKPSYSSIFSASERESLMSQLERSRQELHKDPSVGGNSSAPQSSAPRPFDNVGAAHSTENQDANNSGGPGKGSPSKLGRGFFNKPPKQDAEELSVLEKSAEDAKERGNEFFKIQLWDLAAREYSSAISLSNLSTFQKPKLAAIYLSNRAACYNKLSKHQDALADCKAAMELNPKFWKAWLRAGQACLSLGKFKEASEFLDFAEAESDLKFDDAAKARRIAGELKMVDQLRANGEVERALSCIKSILSESPEISHLKILHVEVLMSCNRYEEALPVLQNLRAEDDFAEVEAAKLHHMHAKALTGLCRIPEALAKYRELLRLDPDNQTILADCKKLRQMNQKMTEGVEAMNSGRFSEARGYFGGAMDIDPNNDSFVASMLGYRAMSFQKQREQTVESQKLHASAQAEVQEATEELEKAQRRLVKAHEKLQLFAKRAETLKSEFEQDEKQSEDVPDPTPPFKTDSGECKGKWALHQAIDVSCAALDKDPCCALALVYRARCYSEIGDLAEAVADYERAINSERLDGTSGLSSHVVRGELREAQRKLSNQPNDHYQILGLGEGGPQVKPEDIKKAYRKLAMKYHPDKQSHLGREARERMERRFKLITEAHSVLSDVSEKRLYDLKKQRASYSARSSASKYSSRFTPGAGSRTGGYGHYSSFGGYGRAGASRGRSAFYGAQDDDDDEWFS